MSDINDNHSNDSEENNSEQNRGIEKDTSSQSLHPSNQRNESPTIIPSTSASNMVSSLQSGIPVVGTIKKIGIRKGNGQGNKPNTITCSTPAALRPILVTSRRKKNKENDNLKTMSASVKKFPMQSQIYIKINVSQMVFNEESRLNVFYASSYDNL